MKLNVRYEETVTVIEVERDLDLYTTVGLETDNIADEKFEEARIQKAFDEKYSIPEYNNLQTETRHIGFSTAKSDDEIFNNDCEPLMSEVADDRIFYKSEIERDKQMEYDEVCGKVRKILAAKPHWAEAFIAVCMDDIDVKDYAASLGIKDASVVSHWLTRAKKKLRKEYLRAF